MVIDDKNLQLICSKLFSMYKNRNYRDYHERDRDHEWGASLITFIMKGCDWNEDIRRYGISPELVNHLRGLYSPALDKRAHIGSFTSEHEYKIWACELEIEELTARYDNLYLASKEEVLREVGPKTVAKAWEKLLGKQQELERLRHEQK